MKKLFYASIALGALIGCSKQSIVEPALEMNIARIFNQYCHNTDRIG